MYNTEIFTKFLFNSSWCSYLTSEKEKIDEELKKDVCVLYVQ